MGTQGLKGATAIFKLNGKTFSMVKVPDNREIVESAHIDVKAGDKMEVKIVDIDPKADDVKWKVNCLYDVKKRPAGQKASTSNASMEVKADARKPNKAKNQREQKRDRHEAKGGKGKR
jgi:predicted RNA-binding protein with RPS1 domain